ncbi:ZIP family metal transporter [Deinococcus aestuarii]|uniref:ZIP family metal transporter n=1 Tax=Deinococcus aestuarii TaxID=2774531 RepID=UPI001C0BC7CE|nr:ZIP family metal transporter [Deinococcus aestuarii]
MNELLTVLALAALPALGNFVGGLLTEFVSVSSRVLSLALHLAAGIILAVVALELLPEALAADPPWLPLGAFVLGGGFFILLEKVTSFVKARAGGNQANGQPIETAGASAILAGVMVDLFSDGILVGTGSTLSLSLGLLLALAQVPADIPEGFATLAKFKRQGTPRARRLLISALLIVPVLLGALLGYLVMRGQPEIYKLTLLAFTAGVLVTLAVEEIIPEAHEEAKSGYESLVLVGGFALFALLTLLFERGSA